MIITLLTGLLLVTGGVWCGFCIPAEAMFAGSLYMTVTGALLSAALITGVASLFLPDVPRLRRELGRIKEKTGAAAGIILLLAGAMLLVWDAAALEAGHPLLMRSPRTTALCVSILALMGCGFCAASTRMTLCWNAEGLALRSVFGVVHRCAWADVTAWDTYRGTPRLYLNGRHFILPRDKRWNDFLRCLNDHRADRSEPPLPPRKSPLAQKRDAHP